MPLSPDAGVRAQFVAKLKLLLLPQTLFDEGLALRAPVFHNHVVHLSLAFILRSQLIAIHSTVNIKIRPQELEVWSYSRH